MSAINSISVDKLVRLIGTPRCPALIDVRPKNESSAGLFRDQPEERIAPASSNFAATHCNGSNAFWSNEVTNFTDETRWQVGP